MTDYTPPFVKRVQKHAHLFGPSENLIKQPQTPQERIEARRHRMRFQDGDLTRRMTAAESAYIDTYARIVESGEFDRARKLAGEIVGHSDLAKQAKAIRAKALLKEASYRASITVHVPSRHKAGQPDASCISAAGESRRLHPALVLPSIGPKFAPAFAAGATPPRYSQTPGAN
jgi:hypothetical protein